MGVRARFGSRQGQDKPATAKEQGTASGKAAVDGGVATPRANGPASSPSRARHAARAPAATLRSDVAEGFAARHLGAIAAAAIVLGALASEAVRLAPRRKSPPLAVLAAELASLRAAAPRRAGLRLLRRLRS